MRLCSSLPANRSVCARRARGEEVCRSRWTEHPPGGDFHLATSGDFEMAIDRRFAMATIHRCVDYANSKGLAIFDGARVQVAGERATSSAGRPAELVVCVYSAV